MRRRQGIAIVVLAGAGLIGLSYFSAQASGGKARITSFQFGGHAGQLITWAAAGYKPNGQVLAGFLNTLTSTTADAQGNATGTLTVPSTTPPGSYLLAVFDPVDPLIAASVGFTVS